MMLKTLHQGLYLFAKSIIEIVLPTRCPSCGDIVHNDKSDIKFGQSGFCPSCWMQLKFITPPACISCSMPFEFEAYDNPNDEGFDDLRKCSDCLQSPPIHDGIRAALFYDDIPRQTILKLKYSGRMAIAQLIADYLQRYLQKDIEMLGKDIWVTPVPLHWTRLLKRTYNQSALIADALITRENVAREDIEHIPDILKRIKRTPPLKGSSAKERQVLLKDAFALNERYKDSIKGRSIILVDDVYTSGSTTNACAQTLKEAGAHHVIIYCWTRVIQL